jgi:class 3 adenylate cyclase
LRAEKGMEISLRPDTTKDLRLRIGIHSSSLVTAGVQRGRKSCFQLFGDRVNTAAHIEITGEKSRIQLLQEIADL